MAFERFWAKVNKTPECWLWTGAQTKGYGQLGYAKGHHYAHRFSWNIHFGPIPKGVLVCHRCDTPLCVRPDHLFLGTTHENVRDKISKGRARGGSSVGSKNGFAKLTEASVANAKAMYRGGKSIYEIAGLLGVSKSTIWNVVSEKYWRHVNGV